MNEPSFPEEFPTLQMKAPKILYALSLHNPHATLVMLNEKQWETRSWRPRSMPRRIAIASTAKTPPDYRKLLQVENFARAMGDTEMVDGCILCTAEVTEIISTTAWLRSHCHRNPTRKVEDEYLFGDYSPRRHAWRLERVIRLESPIPCRGSQGLWHVPPAIAEQIREQQNETYATAS